jgi:hypothetical protein
MNKTIAIDHFTRIENCVDYGTYLYFFKFSVLHQLYDERLRNLGVEKDTNRTRLKEKKPIGCNSAHMVSQQKSKVTAKIKF